MNRLLKADLYRMRKSKLTLVVLILCVAFPIVTALLYAGLNLILNGMLDGDAAGQLIFDGTMMLQSAFSPSSDLGLIIPIFGGIFIYNDISNGSLRNKIVSGYSKTKVFFSSLITCIIFDLIATIIYAAFMLLCGWAFLGFGGLHLEFTQIIYWLITGLLTFVFLATFTTFITLTTKSLPLTLILTIAFTLVMSLLTQVVSILLIADPASSEFTLYFLSLIPFYTITPSIAFDMSLIVFLEGIASYIAFGCLNIFVGLALFKAKDLK